MNSPILHDIAGYICIFAAVFATIGMIRPFMVLWGSAHPTRFKVLTIYGTIALISGAVFMLTIDPAEDPKKDETRPGPFKEQTQ